MHLASTDEHQGQRVRTQASRKYFVEIPLMQKLLQNEKERSKRRMLGRVVVDVFRRFEAVDHVKGDVHLDTGEGVSDFHDRNGGLVEDFHAVAVANARGDKFLPQRVKRKLRPFPEDNQVQIRAGQTETGFEASKYFDTGMRVQFFDSLGHLQNRKRDFLDSDWDQSINQSTEQWMEEYIKQSIVQSINPSIESKPFIQSINQSTSSQLCTLFLSYLIHNVLAHAEFRRCRIDPLKKIPDFGMETQWAPIVITLEIFPREGRDFTALHTADSRMVVLLKGAAFFMTLLRRRVNWPGWGLRQWKQMLASLRWHFELGEMKKRSKFSNFPARTCIQKNWRRGYNLTYRLLLSQRMRNIH